MKDVEQAIKEYRTRIGAQGELADSDLDELEDHLRELTYELRTAGMSTAEAVTEAARRLGDPRQLAREHTRVRSRFGVPLSAGRAWSAALLFMLPHIVWIFSPAIVPDWMSLSWWTLGVYSIIALAVAARRTWARAVVLGIAASVITRFWINPFTLDYPVLWSAEVGVLAFVVPWRRNESSLAAITLALQAYAAFSAWLIHHPLIQPVEDVLQLEPTFERIGLACAVIGCVGTVLRARWSALASAVSALALSGAMIELLTSSGWDSIGPSYRLKWQIWMVGGVATGAMAAAIAAVIGWRSTRSLVGPLQRATR